MGNRPYEPEGLRTGRLTSAHAPLSHASAYPRMSHEGRQTQINPALVSRGRRPLRRSLCAGRTYKPLCFCVPQDFPCRGGSINLRSPGLARALPNRGIRDMLDEQTTHHRTRVHKTMPRRAFVFFGVEVSALTAASPLRRKVRKRPAASASGQGARRQPHRATPRAKKYATIGAGTDEIPLARRVSVRKNHKSY